MVHKLFTFRSVQPRPGQIYLISISWTVSWTYDIHELFVITIYSTIQSEKTVRIKKYLKTIYEQLIDLSSGL